MSTRSVTIRNLPDLQKLYPDYKLQYVEKDSVIRITEKLASIAKQEDPTSCLLAWAMNITLGDGYDPYTIKTVTYVVDHNHKRILGTQHSRALRDAIDHFDKTGEVLPGEYRLIPVSASKRSGVKRVGTSKTAGSGTTGRTLRQAIQAPRHYRTATVEVDD